MKVEMCDRCLRTQGELYKKPVVMVNTLWWKTKNPFLLVQGIDLCQDCWNDFMKMKKELVSKSGAECTKEVNNA